jgi:hypothetical protein
MLRDYFLINNFLTNVQPYHLSLPPSIVRINSHSNILSDIYSDAGMEGQMLEP